MENKHYKLDKEESKKMTGYASIDKPWLNKKKYNINLPVNYCNAYDFMKQCNMNNLDDIALIYDPMIELDSTKITYRELFNRIDACSKAYIAMGVKKGDIVTVSLPSLIENIINFFALNQIGVVANQIHPLASQDEIEYYLQESKSSIFLGYGDVYDKIKKINHSLQHVILVSPMDSMSLKSKLMVIKKQVQSDGISSLKNFKFNEKNSKICMSWKKFISNSKSISDEVLKQNISIDPKLIATLTHTSGTTGKSKAVMSDSKAFVESVKAILQETNLFQRHDRELLILPPFPLYILNNVVYLSLCVGEELVVIPKVDYSNISLYFKKYHPNHLKGIPSTIEAILNDQGFKDYDFSDFKFLISGGGKLTLESEINKFLKEHGCKYKVANGYGMSEAGGCVTCMFENTNEIGTVGRPLVNSNAKAVDLETGKELKYTDEKNGEIWLSSPSCMKGYYNNPDATNELLTIDKDGNVWVKTGDLGRITKEGNIKLIGRIKRMSFIFDSINNTVTKVSHDYMETTLCQNENVEDCVVVPVKDKISQHAMKAYVLMKNSPYDKTINELDQMCKKRFRKYVSPIEYVVVDNIPKNVAGKNDYRYVEDYELGKTHNNKMKVLYKKQISNR